MRLQNISKKFKTVPGVIPWDFFIFWLYPVLSHNARSIIQT
nr:MAG TPA: hypothetical protein [Caudoviricetes sp.]